MNKAEADIVIALASAWNLFVELPIEHSDDLDEFRRAIHAAQEKILCRPARRKLREDTEV